MIKKLYRYRSFNSEMVNDYSHIHRKVINIKKWKFEAFEGLVIPSSPLYFNDPYDCEFCFGTDTLDIANNIPDKENRKKYISVLEQKFRLKSEEKDRILYSDNIEKAIQIVLQAHGESFLISRQEIVNKLNIKGNIDEIKDVVKVVCFSEIYNSMLMWSHYAQNHAGFCIEYHFEETDMFYKHLHPVIYTRDRYVVSKLDIKSGNSEWIYNSTCHKSDVWSYEKEWRIVIPNFNKVIPQKLSYPDGNYVLDLKNNIKAFYLGAKSSRAVRDKIIKFGKENGILVYQMMLSPNTYELEAKKII